MIKKHEIALFINTGTSANPTWKRIKKSTELSISMNAETEEQDYIADESPTTELTKYKPEIEQPLKMLKGEDDFTYFFDKYFSMATGNDAKTEVMLVYKFAETSASTAQNPQFKAWKTDCTVVFNELNANDSELNFNINFSGTVKKGYATITVTSGAEVPTFVEASSNAGGGGTGTGTGN